MQDESVRVKLGVTDHWLPKDAKYRSMSGAKIYVQTKPEWAIAALRMVCSVLEEADIEIPEITWPCPRCHDNGHRVL